MAERTVVDQSVRNLVTGDLTTTYLVEAAAGTGKTRVLVDRYVNCVLHPEHGAGDVRAVAAITFTEKAAGELRQRVREALEAKTREQAAPELARAAAQSALDALDDAPISTIHSFAGRLLREFPVAAGVDPAFEQLDALAADMERARLWEEWLACLAAEDGSGRPVRDWVARLLRAGVRLDDLRKLAAGAKGLFGERYDIAAVDAPPPEPDLHEALASLSRPLQQLRQFCATACLDCSDNGFAAASGLVEAAELLLAEPPSTTDALAARLFGLEVRASGPGGRKGSWDGALGGKERLQEAYGELAAAVGLLRDRYAEYVTGLAVAAADSFVRWAGETQIALGRLDFADLLGRLRDLLATDLGARAALQARFRYILVDEFQDTDPLQAEIVFLLSERAPVARDWRRAVLRPGKLFVVGDPKQSIYRFRRADIAMYDEVADLVRAQPHGRGVVTALSQNFRTTAAAVQWVNESFTAVFRSDQAKGRQPGYEQVSAYRPVAGGAAVSVLLGREYGGRAGESDRARRDEGRALAALVCEMTGPQGARWRVQDRAAEVNPGRSRDEATRPARWGDIAVLMRSTTGLPAYEHALREAGVPYRVEGGTTYFERREVADALVCLRAVDDPSDGPAVYAALHSTMFGFSDNDLFRFVAAGDRLDVFAGAANGAWQTDGGSAGGEATRCHDRGPAADILSALELLRQLHALRSCREPHQVVAELLERTQAPALAACSGPGAPQAMANLEKLVERARAFSGAGGGGLNAFLMWAAEAGDAAGEQESQADDEGDVVRLLTIHKAKGLEFPIVVLAGGALSTGGGRRESIRPIVDRANRRLAVKLRADLPGRPAQLEPALYASLREYESQMDESEQRRLLYVAATRARDHLVLSCFGSLVGSKGEPRKNVMLGLLKDGLPLPQEQACAQDRTDDGLVVLAPAEPPAAATAAFHEPGSLIPARRDWIRARAELLRDAAASAAAVSPSSLEHADFATGDPVIGVPAGRSAALALGTMVHAVMERCSLDHEESVVAAAAAVAAEMERPYLGPQAAALALVCWRSAPVRAAAQAAADGSPVYRELPVGALIGDAIVNGAVDLLYQDGGEWVVVDFKTDRETAAEVLRERYLSQAAAYAVALERATGRKVREVVLVAARAPGTVVTLTVDDAVHDLVVAEVARVAKTGRALAEDETGAG